MTKDDSGQEIKSFLRSFFDGPKTIYINARMKNYISRINLLGLERQKARNQREMEESFSSCCTVAALLALIGAAAYVASEAPVGSSAYDYVDYHWDQFYNHYNTLIWRCRTDGGPNSGEIAPDSKCAGKLKTDSRWPAKILLN